MSDYSSACQDEQAYYGIIAHGSDCFQQHIADSMHGPSGMQLIRAASASGRVTVPPGEDAADVRAPLIVLSKSQKQIGVSGRCGEGHALTFPNST